MKKFRRNAVIIAVFIFASAAVYLNWAYGRSGEEAAEAEALPAEYEMAAETDTGLYFEEAESETAEYFSTARLSRESARGEAKAVLSEVASAEGASQETVDEALAKITVMAENAELEAEIEALICAKGFADCVTYISDTGVTVTVQPPTVEGLSQSAAARITDIVTEKTGFSAQELNIVEIK